MSVRWGDRPEEEMARAARDHYDAPIQRGDRCFYCAAALSYPVVMWAGWGPGGSDEIYLHADCAARLASHLLSDWRLVQNGYERYRKERGPGARGGSAEKSGGPKAKEGSDA